MLKSWRKRLKGSNSQCEKQNVNKDDNMNHSASVFENICFYLNVLKSSQSMFDQFTAAVEEDIKIKVNLLESMRLNMDLSSNQRTFVNVQIMMLKCYSNRVKSFQKVSDNSISKICNEYYKNERDDGTIGYLVKKHIQSLVKMKRRMKQILDVSEKCAVIDLLDKRKVENEENKDLNLSTSVKDNEDQTHSVQPFPSYKYFSFDSPSFSRIHSPENSGFGENEEKNEANTRSV
jgi:hypothetical protein